jgi:hypothetical protein
MRFFSFTLSPESRDSEDRDAEDREVENRNTVVLPKRGKRKQREEKSCLVFAAEHA